MTKKPKKVKPYVGNVQFDVWGNLVEWERNDKHYLTDDNFENGQIVVETWDYVTRATIKKPVAYTPDQLELVMYPSPQPRTGYWNNQSLYIGEINNYYNVPNYEFQDVLEYAGIDKGQYSTHFTFKTVHGGQSYRVFNQDFDAFVKNMNRGQLAGTFTFCKRNSKFGLKVV